MKWLMCLGVVAFLGGCDSSKQELESTKATLSSVQSERDQLKTENATLQKQLDDTKAELAKAKAPATATAAAATPATTKTATDAKKPAAADKSKHHKS
jgi:septal ring factor EnvC (AmiA/AmiB activator)